ncbi:glycosyltransferase family 17-domain-containing protein [Baffinella frigidus]|nr:glycosyltransferase family 17-domain-containing protein [Cryptophyta sp. CCMP2293]
MAPAVHLLLALVVSAGFLCGGGGAAAGGGPADSVFSVDFFGRAINFTLAPDFSAHAIAERWCAEQGLGAGEHVVEGAVADALTDRIEAGMLGKDSEARMKIALEVRQEPLRIIDAFPFFNELEVLEVRLAELYPIVDKFILVESSVTHAGNPKDLFFDANLAAFDQYRDKIIHVVLDSLPESPDAWVRTLAY